MKRALPWRLLPLLVVLVLGPILFVAVAEYNLFISNTVSTAYAEAIIMGVIGAIMLGVAVFLWPQRQALAIVFLLGGAIALAGSGVILLVIGLQIVGNSQYPLAQWLGIGALVIAVFGAIAFSMRRRRARRQQRALVTEAHPIS